VRTFMAPMVGTVVVAIVLLAATGPAEAVCDIGPGTALGPEIVGDARRQNLTLELSVSDRGSLIASYLLDCNGDGDATDPGDRIGVDPGSPTLYIRLGGNDTITIRYKAGTYDAANILGVSSRRFHVTLGPGTNRVTLESETATLRNMEVALDVVGGAGADTVNVLLGQMTDGNGVFSSSVVVRADLGAGNDALNLTLPVLGGASFETHAALGAGSNSVSIAQLPGNRMENSAVTLDVEGGPGVDTVKAAFGGAQLGATRVVVNADLAGGNDAFTGSLDLGTFVNASASVLRFKVKGAAGSDTLVLTRNNTTGGTQNLGGLLEAELLGGAGNDTLKADLEGGGFKMRGTLRLALDGGAGNDAVSAFVDAAEGSDTRVYDLSLTGGFGNDTLKFGLDDANPAFTADSFGFAGTVLVDGGAGVDTCTNTSSAAIPLPAGRAGARALLRKCER
jgi:hypothetical protein